MQSRLFDFVLICFIRLFFFYGDSYKIEKEKIIFNKVKEYALATYNYGNIKSIVKEHNIDVFFKYKRYLA